MVAQLDRRYLRSSAGKSLNRLFAYALFEGRPLTTRGRWINPLVFQMARLIARSRQLKAVERPVFIIGTGRSGTTILGLVLSLHPDIGFLNEPKALWHAAYPGEDIIGNYSRAPARYRLDLKDASEEISASMHKLYGAFLYLTRSKRLLDKYPELVFRAPFVLELFPDAQFLFLVRNGIDTCQSIAQWSEAHGQYVDQAHQDWWGVDNRKWHLLVDQVVREDPMLGDHYREIANFDRWTDMAAVEWLLSMREGVKLQRSHPDAVLRVDYDRLTESSSETLKQIMDFCGLTRSERVLSFASEVLLPIRRRRTVDLHPAIRPAFDQTMHELGMESG